MAMKKKKKIVMCCRDADADGIGCCLLSWDRTCLLC